MVLALTLAVATCSGPSDSLPAAAIPATPKADPQMIAGSDGRAWKRLAYDGLHDPSNEALQYLQEPAEALGTLPPDTYAGNQVDWMEALRSGAIVPRTNLRSTTTVRTLDLDIVFEETADRAFVVFPHRQHTEWLDCDNCHPSIFVAKKGANDFGMLDILNGNYCGQCHGAVSFPLIECNRCHSRPWW